MNLSFPRLTSRGVQDHRYPWGEYQRFEVYQGDRDPHLWNPSIESQAGAHMCHHWLPFDSLGHQEFSPWSGWTVTVCQSQLCYHKSPYQSCSESLAFSCCVELLRAIGQGLRTDSLNNLDSWQSWGGGDLQSDASPWRVTIQDALEAEYWSLKLAIFQALRRYLSSEIRLADQQKWWQNQRTSPLVSTVSVYLSSQLLSRLHWADSS